MKKICVIFTGGTIGSTVKEGYVSTNSKTSSMLINGYYKEHGTKIEFDEVNPISILSENITADDSYALIEAVKEIVDSDEYSGIIITHGTDTLSFSANLLSQVFCDVKIPIVFVSAMFPLDDERTNGFVNFEAAVDFIQRGRKGVFVANMNENQHTRIFKASLLLESAQITGLMYALRDEIVGEYIDGEFGETGHSEKTASANEMLCKDLYVNGSLCTDVLTIESRALLDFKYLSFENDKPKAVLIKLYHSGTMCTEGEDENALRFIDYCNKNGVTVIIGPVDKAANVYESMSRIQEECVIAYDISYEMILVRTMIALGAGADKETLKKVLSAY